MKNYVMTLAFAFSLMLPHAMLAQVVTPPPLPAGIEVAPPDQPFLLGHGFGTQNYACQPINSIGRVGWVLFTPQATLFGDSNEQLVTHFFGPNPQEPNTDPRVLAKGTIRAAWQARDTSTVWARVFPLSQPSFDPAFVRPNSVPWLLLDARGVQEGPTGGDTLVGTTFIQRVNTAGGLAPTTGCSQASDVGKKAFVPYTADYFFYADASTLDND